MTCINRLTARLSFWMLLYLVCPLPVQAMPGLPYESIPGELQVEMSDKNRVPQVEFQSEPMSGGTLLKETDYVGEGQFPLTYTRYISSPIALVDGACSSDNYDSCIRNHRTTYDLIQVCTGGICISFYQNLKPTGPDSRDTLVRNGVVNGVT